MSAAAFPSPEQRLVLAMLVVAVETLSGADSREGGRCFWEWDGDVRGDFVIIWHSSSAFITLDCCLHVSGGGESRGIAALHQLPCFWCSSWKCAEASKAETSS